MASDDPTGGTRAVSYRTLILLAALCGGVGGMAVAAYYTVLRAMLHVVWVPGASGLERLLGAASAPGATILLTMLGGVLVGLATRRLGPAGEIEAVVDNIHLERGRLDVTKAPSMTVTSLLSIAFGGSAGPEAPSVQIVGSGASWLGDRLELQGEQVRTLTFCGMAAALGAFFGAPLGGALFALEIPHRRGLEYYEALIPSLAASTCSFLTFYGLTGYHGALYHFESVPEVSLELMLQGAALGLTGAAVAVVFIALFQGVKRITAPLRGRPVLLGAVGGLAIGAIATALPSELPATTLFWGEYELRGLLTETDLAAQYGTWTAAGLLLLLAVGKMLAVAFTLHTGFRGGFIFPLFFIGAAVGAAVTAASGGAVELSVAALCLMAAVNVAVTKTPVSTSIILTTISSTSMLPVIALASLTSFLLTTRVTLIRTQRSRTPAPGGAAGLAAVRPAFERDPAAHRAAESGA